MKTIGLNFLVNRKKWNHFGLSIHIILNQISLVKLLDKVNINSDNLILISQNHVFNFLEDNGEDGYIIFRVKYFYYPMKKRYLWEDRFNINFSYFKFLYHFTFFLIILRCIFGNTQIGRTVTKVSNLSISYIAYSNLSIFVPTILNI